MKLSGYFREIPQISRRDAFWGAIPAGDVYEGENVLGRLWMELRHHIRQNDPLAQASAWAPRIDVGALSLDQQHQTAETPSARPVYAGIGARQTPPRVLEQMTKLASELADRGWHLHSGGAAGADTAFASGALEHERTLFLPWSSFNGHAGPDCRVAGPDVTARHMAIAAALHPAWDRCHARARQFHARNVSILLGPHGNEPVDAAVCWTPAGETVGGTGMAIRIAEAHGIPIINLATTTTDAAEAQLEQIFEAHAQRAGTRHTTPTAKTSLSEQESTAMTDDLDTSPIPPAIEKRIAEEAEGFSVTGYAAEQAAVFGATPPSDEPDPRDVWFVSAKELLEKSESATEIAPRAFQNIAEAIDLIVDTATPDGYQMASRRESVLYGIVNMFHYQLTETETQIAELEQNIQTTKKAYSETIEDKGADVATEELEHKTRRYLDLAGMRDLWEIFRDFAGTAYYEKCRKAWQPTTGSHISETSDIASRIDSRDHQRAQKSLGNRKDIPDGTRVAVTGYKHGPDYTTIFATLDAVRAKYPDMVLLHGGAKGVQQICAKWAENKDVPQVAFYPEYKHKNDRGAIPRRDREILKANPRGVIAFAGPDYKPTFLHREAVKLGIKPFVVSGAESQRQVPSQAIVLQTPVDQLPTTAPQISSDKHTPALPDPRLGPLSDHTADLLRDRFLAFMEVVVPEHETDPQQRQNAMSRIIQAVHDHQAKPGGLEDQADTHAKEVRKLAPAEGLSEVVDMQLAEAVDSAYQVTSAIDRAEQIRAGLADVYKEQHGEQWRPAASYAPKPDATVTAASAEASRAIQERRDSHDLAHQIKGTPVAIAGTKDDNVPRETVFAILDAFHKEIPDMYLVHGNAPGTQRMANEWATARNRPQLTYYPDTRNESLSRAILLRDKEIIDHGPLTVIDFSPSDKRTALATMADKKGLNVQIASRLLHGADQTVDQDRSIAARKEQQTREQGGGMSM